MGFEFELLGTLEIAAEAVEVGGIVELAEVFPAGVVADHGGGVVGDGLDHGIAAGDTRAGVVLFQIGGLAGWGEQLPLAKGREFGAGHSHLVHEDRGDGAGLGEQRRDGGRWIVGGERGAEGVGDGRSRDRDASGSRVIGRQDCQRCENQKPTGRDGRAAHGKGDHRGHSPLGDGNGAQEFRQVAPQFRRNLAG